MLQMILGVYYEIVDVHNYILDSGHYGLHESLESGRASKETHGRGNPFELAHSWYGEGGVTARLGL